MAPALLLFTLASCWSIKTCICEHIIGVSVTQFSDLTVWLKYDFGNHTKQIICCKQHIKKTCIQLKKEERATL